MTDKIKEAAEKYAFRVPYDGSNNFYNEDRYKGFVDGATSEAAREYWDAAREDEAGKWEAQLKEERERSKKLLEALGWYADSGNYLAATNYPDDGVNSDTMLATAYAQKRIEKKAITAINEYKSSPSEK